MSSESEAQRTLLVLGVGGLVVAVVCFLVAANQWPDPDAVYKRDQGSALVTWTMLTIGGIAQLAVLVSLVGWGVGLGVRWSGLVDSASSARASTGRFSGVTPLAPAHEDD